MADRAFWRRGQGPLVELPISVTRFGRIPVIGMSVLLAPTWLRDQLLASMRGRPLLNFALHGIDLIDAVFDEMPGGLVARQPELQRPLSAKIRALDETLAAIGRQARFATLREAATALAM
jgi:hypothetical protein